MRLDCLLVGMALLAACDDGGGGEEILCRGKALCDAGDLSDATIDCNPIENTGCVQGEQCAWIRVDEDGRGEFGCVPIGDDAIGGTCMVGPVGPSTGWDSCVGVAVCLDARCHQLCTVAPDSCAPPSTCTARPDVFTEIGGDVLPLGVCGAPP